MAAPTTLELEIPCALVRSEPRALKATAYVPGSAANGSVSRLVVFAHSAGGSRESALVRYAGERLGGEAGTVVVAFDFAYRSEGRKGPPDRMGKLVEATVAAMDWVLGPDFAAALHGACGATVALDDLYLAGASMGCRALAHFVCHHLTRIAHIFHGLIFFGYPLHPASDPEKLRDAPLYRLDAAVRVCFITGSRDKLCAPDELAPVTARMTAAHETHIVADADHSFNVLKRTGMTQADVFASLLDTAIAFMDSLSHAPVAISVPPSNLASPASGSKRRQLDAAEPSAPSDPPSDDIDPQVVPTASAVLDAHPPAPPPAKRHKPLAPAAGTNATR